MGNDDPFVRMDTGDARTSIPKVTEEIHKLTPDSLVTLYELDISEIKINISLIQPQLIQGEILCFHNMEVLRGKIIKFDGKSFFPIPIFVEGFEMNSSGELPRPKLTLPAMKGIRELEEEDPNNYSWKALKRSILELDNLIGSTVTRIRTFAKYLDSDNDIPDVGGSSDAHAQFPREIFYIDSKLQEDKDGIQFELSTFSDMENFKLPGRFVLASRCPWAYRGEGCCYEYKALTSAERAEQVKIHGDSDHLPDFAPPVATDENKTIVSEFVKQAKETGTNYAYNPASIGLAANCSNTDITCPAEYDKTKAYPKGKVVYIKKDGIQYYFVAKGNPLTGTSGYPDCAATPDCTCAGSAATTCCCVPAYTPPPHVDYWIPDKCAKTMAGCKFRWGSTGQAKNDDGTGSKVGVTGHLNFGGFPGTNTRISI